MQQWPDINEPESVRLAVLWDHPFGITANMPKLKQVVSMGAGMDHINADNSIAPNVSRSRIVTQALQHNMVQYVLQYILYDHRHHASYLKQQTHQHWQVLEDAAMPVVGFLGLGKLGQYVANQCAALGFQTMAWTAQQQHPDHPCLHGKDGLRQICQNSRYLVVLLPLNDATEGVINRQTLSWCNPNTVLINVGRGGHVIEADLIQALDDGLIKQAILDVFNQEPLPANHHFWKHPKITVTPHSSARSDVTQTAEQIVNFYHQL